MPSSPGVKGTRIGDRFRALRKDVSLAVGVLGYENILQAWVKHQLRKYIPSELRRRQLLFPSLTFKTCTLPRIVMAPKMEYTKFGVVERVIGRLMSKFVKAAETFGESHHTAVQSWEIVFRDSEFGSSFTDQFIEALYRFPSIASVSFSRSPEYARSRTGSDGEFSYASLMGSLPPCVSYATFDNVLNAEELSTMAKFLGSQACAGIVGLAVRNSGFTKNDVRPLFRIIENLYPVSPTLVACCSILTCVATCCATRDVPPSLSIFASGARCGTRPFAQRHRRGRKDR